jgi:hypothetical protein
MKNSLSKSFLAVLVLVLGSLACSALGSSALLEDDFSGSDYVWGTGTDADSAVEYANDALNFFVNKDFFFVWSTPSDEVYENVHIEVTARNDSTDPTGAFGIICNLQTLDTSYYFAITGAGEYAIGRYTLTDDILLTNEGQWGESDAITSGAASYRIGADCGNGTLTLYVDGQQIDSVNDTTYSSGSVKRLMARM